MGTVTQFAFVDGYQHGIIVGDSGSLITTHNPDHETGLNMFSVSPNTYIDCLTRIGD